MKKFKLALLALILTLALGSLNTISAAEEDEKTDVTFKIEKGSVVDPTLPEGPGEEIDPFDPNENVDTDFRIWYLPKMFHFETGKISATEQSFKTVGNHPTAAAVADIREDRNGWNFTATLSELKNIAADDVLVGASINWTQKLFEIVDPATMEKVTDTLPGVTEINLTKGNAVSVLKAENNQGFGYHSAEISEVELVVPGKQGKTGDYTGIVKWKLTQTPNVQQ